MNGRSRLIGSATGLSFPAGPLTAGTAIIWVHADNVVRHPESYAEAPPTISRALWDPAIADPFALLMVLSALFLTIAIAQVTLTLGRLAWRLPGRGANTVLLLLFGGCEAIAVAGMIVLSQYTGQFHSQLHDLGSYMLFFGHAIGISLSGWLIVRLRRAAAGDPRAATAVRVLCQAEKCPRRALRIAVLSAAYGAVYFGGKHLPDAYFFWQRLVLSVTEVVLILCFLGYLLSLWPLVRAGRTMG